MSAFDEHDKQTALALCIHGPKWHARWGDGCPHCVRLVEILRAERDEAAAYKRGCGDAKIGLLAIESDRELGRAEERAEWAGVAAQVDALAAQVAQWHAAIRAPAPQPAPVEATPRGAGRWILRLVCCGHPCREGDAVTTPALQVDEEEIDSAWLVAFDDNEAWQPSESAGLFFSYRAAAEYVAEVNKARVAAGEGEHAEWTILRCLPFKLRVVNDFRDEAANEAHALAAKGDAVIHIAGEMRDLMQRCTRCGAVLSDYRNASWREGEPAPRGFGVGHMVERWSGGYSSFKNGEPTCAPAKGGA